MRASFDLEPHRHDPRRVDLLRIAGAALDAIDPEQAVGRALTPTAAGLRVEDTELVLNDYRRIVVLGFGKASVAMGRAAAEAFGKADVTGVVVANTTGDAGPIDVVLGAHPIPDERSVAGGRRILEAAARTGPDDLALVLISGGGSALLAVPAHNLDITHLQEVNELLLRSGADIGELNTVRKHLSAVKGGRLAEALAGAGGLVTLILSDVIGNPLDVIASGPTVPDPTTFADALDVLDRYRLRAAVPTEVTTHLEAGAAGRFQDTPTGGEVFDRQVVSLVADAAVAARAAAEAGRAAGWTSRVVTTRLAGEARAVADDLVAAASDLELGELLVFAGETTVTVTGAGRGGRNQELALATSIALAGREDVVVLSLGTDGIDGLSDAAGGFGDGTAVARGRTLGIDAERSLENNDSNPFLTSVGDVVNCGPTGTNVGDLVLVARTG